MEYNIESEVRILIHGKENYCSKSKKGNLKTKKLLKITILDEQEPWKSEARQWKSNQWKSEVEEIWIYQNLESGRHSIYIWK